MQKPLEQWYLCTLVQKFLSSNVTSTGSEIRKALFNVIMQQKLLFFQYIYAVNQVVKKYWEYLAVTWIAKLAQPYPNIHTSDLFNIRPNEPPKIGQYMPLILKKYWANINFLRGTVCEYMIALNQEILFFLKKCSLLYFILYLF